jgi:hypothetical protein
LILKTPGGIYVELGNIMGVINVFNNMGVIPIVAVKVVIVLFNDGTTSRTENSEISGSETE